MKGAGKIVTFLGNATYLNSVIPNNHITDVFIDLSHAYVEGYTNVSSTYGKMKTITIVNPMRIVLPYKDIVNYHFVDTGIKYKKKNPGYAYTKGVSNDVIETINRRIRIAKLLTLILLRIDDDILLLDSDVLLPRSLPRFEGTSTICIPTKAKPNEKIIEFCKSTNLFIPYEVREKLLDIIDGYMIHEKYIPSPIDLYIHERLHSNVIRMKGVCHYVDGDLVCL